MKPKPLKTYEVQYTNDFGETYQTMTVEAMTRSSAYIMVYCKIPISAAITDLKEIEREGVVTA